MSGPIDNSTQLKKNMWYFQNFWWYGEVLLYSISLWHPWDSHYLLSI